MLLTPEYIKSSKIGTFCLWPHIPPTIIMMVQHCNPLMWGRNWNTNEHGIAQRGGARCATAKAPCQWTNNRSEKRDDGKMPGREEEDATLRGKGQKWMPKVKQSAGYCKVYCQPEHIIQAEYDNVVSVSERRHLHSQTFNLSFCSHPALLFL